jgi:outer membrane autotransporter protein
MTTDIHTSVLRTTPLRRQRAKKSRTAFRRRILCTGIAAAMVCAAAPAFAASATWSVAPGSNDWNTAGNWTAGGPPNGLADTATFFQTPAFRSPTLSMSVQVATLNFLAGADAFTMTASANTTLRISGTGIVNNSGTTQNFVTVASSGSFFRFSNSATAGDQTVFTINGGSGIPGTNAGVYFEGHSTAGHGTFINLGNTASSAGNPFLYGATTQFQQDSTAGNGTFTNQGGTVSGALGGHTFFLTNSTAGNGTFTVNGGTAAGASGGVITFYHDSTAGNGTFTVNGGTASGASGGLIEFVHFNDAGSGIFTVNGSSVSGASGGSIQFSGFANWGSATLIANGGSNGGAGGSIEFNSLSNGGHANVQVNGASVNNGPINNNLGNFGGTLKISGWTNAGHATFTTNGGSAANTQGGSTDFYGFSSADSGTFTTNAGNNPGPFNIENFGIAGGGTTSFHDMTTAGSGTFTTNGTIDSTPVLLATPGTMFFYDFASAGNGTFTTNGASGGGGAAFGGRVFFLDNATAANATFTMNAGGDGPSGGGYLAFSGHATAANAYITLNGGAFPGPTGGHAFFGGHATAANAYITLNGGTSSGGSGGQLVFNESTATAGSAIILNNGGTVSGANGGWTQFYAGSAGNATLVAYAGSNGGLGGVIYLWDSSVGDTAKVHVFGNGSLNIAGHSAPGVGIGSLEEDGNVFLGARNLTVGSNNLSTTFTGVIHDGGPGGSGSTGGSFTKTGAGMLTLTGANTYTGGTTIEQGVLSFANGSLGSTGTVDFAGNSTLRWEPGNTQDLSSRLKIEDGVNATLDTNNNHITLANAIQLGATGTGALTKAGAGVLTLLGDNTYTGGTTILPATIPPGTYPPGTIFFAPALQLGNGGTTGSIVGNVTDNATLIFNRSDDITFPGIISGTGTVTKEGAGKLTILGANTYQSGTTINAGILFLGDGITPGAALGAGDVRVNANTTFQLNLANGETFANNVLNTGHVVADDAPVSNYTMSGLITGSGDFTKTGTNTVTVTGNNSYTGGTFITAGTLAAGNATAFGNGNLTMSGGTLRTTGPLAVNLGAGNILFAGGTYAAKIGGTTPGVTHDQLVTTGSANISGGMIALLQQNGFLLQAGTQIVLLSAAGGVAGGTANGTAATNVTGLSAFSNSPLLIPVVNLYTTSVVLEAMQGSFAGLSGFLGFTPNQIAVATALDSLIAQTGGKTGIFKEIDFLDKQSLPQLLAALDRISPEELTSIFDLTKSLANVQTTNIQRRLEEIRKSNAADIAALGGLSGGGGAPGPTGKRAREIPIANEERWGLWFTGSGEFTHVGSTTNAAGFSLDSGGVTAGVDYRFTDHFAAGISLGYMNTTASLSNGGKIDADGGRVGAYATYFDRGFYLDAAVNGGINSYDTRRSTPNNTAATGKPEGSEINVLLATGYDWKWKGLTLGPTASFQYTNVQLDGFTETGGFAPLRFATQSADSLRSALGFHATFDQKVGRAIIRPEVRAAWQHEFGDTSYSLTSSFATLGGSAFTVAGPETGRDSLLVGAGLSVLFNERFSIYAYYDGELLRANYSSHNISAGFRYRF